MKKNLFFISVLVVTMFAGLFSAQSIFWYKVGPDGKTWTLKTNWREDPINYKRVRGEFPKTILTSDQDKEEDCGCAGG